MNAQFAAVPMLAIVLFLCVLFPTICKATSKGDKGKGKSGPFTLDSFDSIGHQNLSGNNATRSSTTLGGKSTILRPTAVRADSSASYADWVNALPISLGNTPFNTNQQTVCQQYLSGNNATRSSTTLGGKSTFLRPTAVRADSSASYADWDNGLPISSGSTPFNTNPKSVGQQYLSGNYAPGAAQPLEADRVLRPTAVRADSSVSFNARVRGQQAGGLTSSTTSTSTYFPAVKANALMQAGIKKSELMPPSWFSYGGSNRK